MSQNFAIFQTKFLILVSYCLSKIFEIIYSIPRFNCQRDLRWENNKYKSVSHLQMISLPNVKNAKVCLVSKKNE